MSNKNIQYFQIVYKKTFINAENLKYIITQTNYNTLQK